MIACVHQPNFLPWLGFFAKVAQSDIYVVMDNVQFTKNCWTNRVKIAGNGEALTTYADKCSTPFGITDPFALVHRVPNVPDGVLNAFRHH